MDHKNIDIPITSFTLNELVSLSGNHTQGLSNECIATENESHLEAFRFPCRINAFIIGIGLEGQTTLSYNLHQCHLKKNTMFLFGPNTILQVKDDGNFKAQVVAISSEFIRQLNIDLKNIIPTLLRFATHPCFELNDELCANIGEYIQLIRKENIQSDNRYTQEIIRNLLSALLFKVNDVIYHFIAEHPEVEQPIHDRTENYFRRFMQLLAENYRTERSVRFYSDELCITPKYLTTIIKRISGRSVSEWIDNYVILEAKTLLKNSHLSIQEISILLHFPNQSFFGSYFKRNTGMSPTQYKMQE